MSKRIFLFPILVALTLCFLPAVSGECSGEIDMTGVVGWVEDGDTFRMALGDWVRLADVNAPNETEEGYSESLYFLLGLVHNKTVYLDIDDINMTDKHGRLVCVVYVDYNSTYVINVNKALLVYGRAEIWDHDNEFDPYTWSLYCPMQSIRGLHALSRYLQLLADYDLLNSTYQTLLSNYTELMSDFAELQGNYTRLMSDYSSLQSSFHTLNSTLANLQSDFDVLNSTNNDLLMSYNALQSSHDQLQGQYDQLNSTYNTLQDSFDQLQLDKETVLVEVETMRNLVYAFLILTIVIASISTFALLRRPKTTVEEAKAMETGNARAFLTYLLNLSRMHAYIYLESTLFLR